MILTKSQIKKWSAMILGLVCVALLFNLIFSKGTNIKAARPAAMTMARTTQNQTGVTKPVTGDDIARYNPELNVNLLKRIDGRTMPSPSRNPFEFPPPPAPPKQDQSPIQNYVAPPPKPPPIPLKAIGYSVKAGGVPEAVVMDDDGVYVVHVGEIFAKRYRVISLTPNWVEIEDASTKQSIQLPIAP
jgi:hypothetical protein